MLDEWGDQVKAAGPARPVLVLGWGSVPQVGSEVRVVSDEKQARQLAQERDAARRAAELVTARRPASLEELFEQGATGDLNLILKADVQGSVEALADALSKIDVPEVRLRILHRGVGAITDRDVTLAKASNAIIVGFNVRPDPNARQTAEAEGIDIRTYRVIYEAISEIENALKGLLAPEYKEQVLGSAVVLELFKSGRTIYAGSRVTHGEIVRSAQVRLIRDGTVVWEGRLASLKRFKDDVREVREGFECGIGLDGYNDVKVDDVIEAFEIREIPRA
jgi:translation initiation factor IF-2